MKIKSKTRKFNDRMIIEVPKAIRHNFKYGEEVFITKITAKA